MLRSMIGVLPVAINTIMVSPMARPKPIMIAAKIPGEAEGRITRHTVCQRLAPRAREAALRLDGTLDKESSAMVKIKGITAKPKAKAMTIQLRGSYRVPVALNSQSLKSPANNHCSTNGPRTMAAATARINTVV